MSIAFRTATDPLYAKLRKQTYLHVEKGSKEQAIKSASEFHQRYPNDPESNFNMARALVRQEKQAKAVTFAEAANKIMPNKSSYVLLLGRLYLDFHLYEFAAPLLRETAAKLPNDVLMQWAMADFFMVLGNGAEAQVYYEKALSLNPEPEQKFNLLEDYARCLAASNELEKALATYEVIEDLPGGKVLGLIKRSEIGTYLPDSEITRELTELLDKPEIATEQKSNILLSLGNMHDRARQHDEAFEFWVKSRALKTIKEGGSLGFNIVNSIKEFYTPSLLTQASEYGHQSDRPIFVVGMPRSGTTLTEQIISAHPDAYGVGELGRMTKLNEPFANDYIGPGHVEKIVKNAKAGELVARAKETLHLLEVLAGTEPRFIVDKMPNQYLAMGYIHLCFPNAKYIHCQRHPADSFVSSFQNNMSAFHDYSFDQTIYAEAYLAKESIMAYWKSIFPEKIFELRYERLVTRPEETVQEMLTFLGLPWDPACMKFFDKARTVKTFSRDQVRNPIYTSSVYRWKKYEKHLGPLFAALKEANFEYPEN